MNIHTHTPVAILALNLESEQAERAAIERAGLSAQLIKQVEGAYKGETERSYVFDVGHSGAHFGELKQSALNACLNLAESHGQESVLFLTYAREAQLIFCNSREVETLGHWRAVPREVAMQGHNWTRDGLQYYIVVPSAEEQAIKRINM